VPVKEINGQDEYQFQTLYDKIIAAKRANPNADITAHEVEIDQMVYGLYGLTKEEIVIVEKSVGG
jgi:adenine-specific DNA-methyltransferase